MNYINNLEELAEGKNREFLSANRELFSPNREITGIAAFAHQRTAVMILAGAPSHRVQSATTASGERVKVNTSLLHRRFMYSGIVAKKPFVPGERLGSPIAMRGAPKAAEGIPDAWNVFPLTRRPLCGRTAPLPSGRSMGSAWAMLQSCKLTN
jgi:hypothetical protein